MAERRDLCVLVNRQGGEDGFLICHGGAERDPMTKKRNRAKHTTTFEERLAEEAQKCKAAADKKPSGSKSRERLLARARQMETASQINRWLSSAGQSAPRALEDILAYQNK
jgi:hypothetical protein